MSSGKIAFIVGPTAVGKTDVALHLAQKLSAEIVSCDAMQVYKEINIATSKPTVKMQQDVAHHLIDLVSVTEEFDVAAFNQKALATIADIRKRKKLPLVVGGSGMYMQVLLDGIFEQKARDPQLRTQLQQRIEQEGNEALYAELKNVDAVAAGKIHLNDSRRIVRALEVYYTTAQPISALQKLRQGLWGKEGIVLFALNRERRLLYDRINQRVEQMFDEGLLDEIKALEGLSLSRTAQAIIGVKEVQGYLSGQHSLAEAKEQMKLNTRHLAKRQLTWFRKEQRLQWIDIAAGQSSTEVADKILNRLKKVA